MTRRRALGAGIVVTALYAALAAWSGRLSPLARQPLLDGLAPPTPYRWVDPPPELEDSNEPPTPGAFTIRLGPAGSETATFTTGDAQVTLILPKGSFASAPGQRGVRVTIEPLAPSGFAAPEPPLRIVGNVVEVRATYRPSGEPARLAAPITVVLIYPRLANDHRGHTIVVSSDGAAWGAVESHDLASIQQVDAATEDLGLVAVAGSPPSPSAIPGASAGRPSAAALVIVMAIALLAVAAWAALRGRRRAARTGGSPSRPGRGAGRGSRRSR